MRNGLLKVGCVLAVLADHSQAAIDLQVIQCSGAVQQIEQPNIIYSCEGDLLLSSGRISSEGEITISATKSLTLQGVTLDALNVTLTSDTIILGSDTIFSVKQTTSLYSNSPNSLPVLNIAPGSNVFSPGGVFPSVVPSVTAVGYTLSNQSASTGALTVSGAISASAEPAEQEGGGSTDFTFLLGLCIATLLLNGRHVA